jgi:hypothetical protein
MFGEKVQMAAPLSKGAGVGDDFFWTSSMPIVLASAFTTRGRVKVARMENNFMIGALFLVALNENGVRDFVRCHDLMKRERNPQRKDGEKIFLFMSSYYWTL